MIYDCFTLRDELDMLELRLSILDRVVDNFVICEADKTFTNQPKPYTYLENIERFEKWAPKITYLPIQLDDEGLDFTTKDTTYTPTSAAWQFEYQQRSALVYGLENVQDTDVVLLGDIDEIPYPSLIPNITHPSIFIMDFFYYYFNNKSIGPRDATWLGTTAIPGNCLHYYSSLQEFRDNRYKFSPIFGGWHLSFIGGKDMMKRKIQSISHTEYNKEEFYSDANIELCLRSGKDIFDREGMNFKVFPIADIFPQDILPVLEKYPNFIFR